jgi:hypothetical protein
LKKQPTPMQRNIMFVAEAMTPGVDGASCSSQRR